MGDGQWLVHNGCRLYPDKVHPVTGVQFDSAGYPIFNSAFDTKLSSNLVGNTITDTAQFKAATQQLAEAIKADPSLARQFTDEQLAAIVRGDAKIPGYTWHHHQDGETLQLVDEWTHSKTGHQGGRKNTGGRP